MRYLAYVLILILVLLSGCGGGLTPVAPTQRSVRAAAAIPTAPGDAVFRMTQEWMTRTFTSSPEPIRFADRESGILTAVGQIDYPCSWLDCMTKGDWRVGFQMNVTLKPGRLETVFRDLELLSPPFATDLSGGGMRGPVWSQRDMDAIRPQLLQLHAELVERLR